MNCEFETIAENLHKCKICGYTVRLVQNPEKIYRECGPRQQQEKQFSNGEPPKNTNTTFPAQPVVSTPQFPSLPKQIKNFSQAMVNFAKDGFKTVSKEEQERRLAICEGKEATETSEAVAKCENFVQGRCKLCGCVAAYKTRLASSVCPDNPPRW